MAQPTKRQQRTSRTATGAAHDSAASVARTERQPRQPRQPRSVRTGRAPKARTPKARTRSIARTKAQSRATDTSSTSRAAFSFGGIATRMHDAIVAVPARIMQPRILFALAVAVLTLIGLMMVFSASSINALNNSVQGNNPLFYLIKQSIYLVPALILFFCFSRCDYHKLYSSFFWPLYLGIAFMLLLVLTPFAGHDAYGASRWISFAGFTLQPSEFAKAIIVIGACRLCTLYFEQGISQKDAMLFLVLWIVAPMALIIKQPDKGTTLVLGITLLIMFYYAGGSGKVCAGVSAAGLLGFIGLSVKDSYSYARLLGMINPWDNPETFGYQLIQGFYAFANGGIFGTGVGMGKQKYGYLPMAYNDFIFSVIGEELGFIGALVILVCFGIILYAGLSIAKQAQDMAGRLIALGTTTIFIFQALLNICGVLGLFPLSGKPIPFVSYGGSSIISSFMLAGILVSVSRHTQLPQTPSEAMRSSLSIARNAGEESYDGAERSYAARTPRQTRTPARNSRTLQPRASILRGISFRPPRAQERGRRLMSAAPESETSDVSIVAVRPRRLPSPEASQPANETSDLRRSRRPKEERTRTIDERRRYRMELRERTVRLPDTSIDRSLADQVPIRTRTHQQVRVRKGANGYERIDIGPSATERLRGSQQKRGSDTRDTTNRYHR